MASGNENVILCERGVRTFESYTRNILDLQSIPVIQKLSHLPIIRPFAPAATAALAIGSTSHHFPPAWLGSMAKEIGRAHV